jgi:hypothetical protein
MGRHERIVTWLKLIGAIAALCVGFLFAYAPSLSESPGNAIVWLAWAGAGLGVLSLYLGSMVNGALAAAVAALVASALGFVGVGQMELEWNLGYVLWLLAAIPLVTAGCMELRHWWVAKRVRSP